MLHFSLNLDTLRNVCSILRVSTSKSQVSIVLDHSEKDRVSKIANDFGFTDSALCAYLVRLFLSNYDDEPLPPIAREYNQKLRIKLQ